MIYKMNDIKKLRKWIKEAVSEVDSDSNIDALVKTVGMSDSIEEAREFEGSIYTMIRPLNLNCSTVQTVLNADGLYTNIRITKYNREYKDVESFEKND